CKNSAIGESNLPANRAAMAADRLATDLRHRRPHGRTGIAPAARPPATPPGRRRRIRRPDRPRPPLLRLPTPPLARSLPAGLGRRDRSRGSGTRPGRGRRYTDDCPARLCRAKPADLRPPDRVLERAAPVWWSRTDRVVVDGAMQSGLLYQRIKELN